MLLLNRILSTGSVALDLATGEMVRIRRCRTASPLLPFSRRGRHYLVASGREVSGAFIEVWGGPGEAPVARPADIDIVRASLADARDGRPRVVSLRVDDSACWRRTVHDIAGEATLAGFVPVDIEVLGRTLRSAHGRWPRWLADRTLVVLAHGAATPPGAAGLLRLATRDARPHLVVCSRLDDFQPGRLWPPPAAVHDAPADSWAEESPDGLAAQAWQKVEQGSTGDATAALARWAIELAPTPETKAVARAALSRTLIAQGRPLEARAALAADPVASAAVLPAPVRARMAQAERELQEVEAAPPAVRVGMARELLHILELCHHVEDELTTLSRVLALLRDRLAAASLTFLCEEADEVRVVAHAGPLPAEWQAARHALRAGTIVRPEPGDPVPQGAWLVRYAGRPVGALACRWSGLLPVGLDDADALLSMAALAVAPLLYAVADRRPVDVAADCPELVGDSDAMRALRAAAIKAARSPFPVLIEGESGSGKEVVARLIHHSSARRDRGLQALNCAALADELAEAELFGHARGAFTGAVAERPGLFEQATGGTLFLDEVSELSLRIQAKLLRVLQEQEVRRLGETHVRRIDVRVVAASNRPLAAEVEAGRFRRDLRYRLDVVRLQVPPLRERLDDLPALVRHLWADLCARTGSRAVLAPSALAALGRYDWPGNVRELHNVLASALVAAPPRGMVPAAQLPSHIGRAAALGGPRSLVDARREFEMRYVRAALARANGRIGTAARDLGLSRQGLAKLLARHAIGAVSGAPASPISRVASRD